MTTRRTILKALAGVAFAADMLPPAAEAADTAVDAARHRAHLDPNVIAKDEDFWLMVRQAYVLDSNIVNLNNGGSSPAPRVALEAMKRALDAANVNPSIVLLREQEPRVEQARRELARLFGCESMEMAITRNASESLATLVMGMDLKSGDEVITTDHSYPRVLQTWRQRSRREGIVVKVLSPSSEGQSQGDLANLVMNAVTERTRVIEICHVTNVLGRIWPVKEIVAQARLRKIDVIVDGAHALAHFPFTNAELNCDFYATTLHKWLGAPIGTGMLFVRKERIAGMWALMPQPATLDNDIKKFEETGTRPAAMRLAILEALRFTVGIGIDRKAARLRFLRDRWSARLVGREEARVLTPSDPTLACGIGYVATPKHDCVKVAARLMEKHGISITAVPTWREPGVRISPNVYTSLAEIDQFSEAFDTVLRDLA